MERTENKNNTLKIASLLLILLGIVIFFFFGNDSEEMPNNDSNSQSDLGVVEFEGKKYRYNSNLFNIMFLGIDNEGEMIEHDIPGFAGQSDTIMILSLNKETKGGMILQVPRDTMTEIDIYDGSGNRYDTKEGQITLQYAYGSGGENSCWAMKKTVSELLYDLPIDGYLALSIDSVAILNDAISGVTLTFPKDYTDIDPAFAKGATVTLTGEQAHDYIRSRDTDVNFSNQDRMERQLHYIPALVNGIKSKVGAGGDYYEMFYPLLAEYMLTDMREDQIETFAEFDLVEANVQFLPGEWVSGEEHDEYHVNDEELQKNLIETFYILAE